MNCCGEPPTWRCCNSVHGAHATPSEASETRENAQVGHQHEVQPSTSCAAAANATFLDLLSVHVITCAVTYVEMSSIGIIKQMQKRTFK